jgi:hypothetical protein
MPLRRSPTSRELPVVWAFQELPFHSQVVVSPVPALAVPPKSTQRSRTGS